MDETENCFDYYVSEKIKDKNPEYNEEFLIPFYCFSSLQIVFYEKKLITENSIARAKIQLNLQTFLASQPQSIPIELYYPFKGAQPSFNFSITYFPLQNLPTKKATNPSLIYIYLTYDPPLQLNTQEVRLIFRGIEDNGTVYDPSTNSNVIIDRESAKCGPSGLTQVIKIDHRGIQSGKYFFYIKSMGYKGKVALNIATAPTTVDKSNHDEYFLFSDSSVVSVSSSNGIENMYALFPIKLVMTESSVTVDNLSLGYQGLYIQRVPLSLPPNQISEADQNAQKNIITFAGEQLLDAKSINIRNEISPGSRLSLNELYKKNSIDNRPDKIKLSLCFSSSININYDVWTCADAAEEMKAFIFYDDHDSKANVYFDYYGQNLKSKERIFFQLNQFDISVKYIALFAYANHKVHFDRLTPITRKIWSNASCSISDPNSNKELLSFTMPTKDSPCGILIAMFVRIGDDNWEFWPCSRFFDSKKPQSDQPFWTGDCRDFL